jgi:hypothetical protein
VAGRALRGADFPDEHDVDPRLLLDLANRGLGNRLALLDAAAGDDAELGLIRVAEDEQLVGTGLRVLAGDVGGDRRAGSQVFWARILAL